jgi:hypothetical protein
MMMFRRKDGGISVLAKKRSDCGTFFLATTIMWVNLIINVQILFDGKAKSGSETERTR